MARLALAICSVIGLLLVAAMLPLAGSGSAGTFGRQAKTVVEPPAWPAWAHRQVAAAVAPAARQTADHTLSTAEGGEHEQTIARVAPGRAGTRAGLPRQHETPLWLTAPPLQGVSGLVPTPPPRAA